MRTIRKRSPPQCLAELRREARRIERDTGKPPTTTDWDTKDCGDPIREALCNEQHGLCAYCMRRIRPNGNEMKIEHFVARSDKPRKMYEWSNLLGVCNGVAGFDAKGEVQTCDTARGNKPLHVHPAKATPRPETVFGLKPWNGQIHPSEPPAALDCKTLNLNCSVLVEARSQVLKQLRNRLQKDGSRAGIRRLLKVAQTPTTDGLPEFARLASEYLEHKLETR